VRKRGPAAASKEANMRTYTKSAAIALLLSGTALVTAGAASGDDYYGNDRSNGAVMVQFGDISMGYRDGYMDSNHGWHKWNGDSDYQEYRHQHADTYRDYNHDRDENNGVVAVSFGDVSMGYRDGYLDREHRYHRWNGDNDYQTYRYQHADSYRDYNHDRDGNNGVVAFSFGDVSMGYRDGYLDRERRYHRWNGGNDYQTYRYQHAGTYRDYNHDRDGNNGVVAVSFGDVSMGYRDGYLDRQRRYHRWNGDNDYQTYRYQHAGTYRDYNHDRDNNNVTIGFGNIAFGYRDGYWDGGHHWHHWRHRGDYRGYRDQNGSNYHDMNHDREDNNGWQRH
jgi:hypothetical protein